MSNFDCGRKMTYLGGGNFVKILDFDQKPCRGLLQDFLNNSVQILYIFVLTTHPGLIKRSQIDGVL